MSMHADQRARLRALYESGSREDWFAAAREAIAGYYLADPANAYQQSGRSSGAARWRETRECIAQAVHRDGEFLDVGCANGLLLASLIGWCQERGFAIQPHGIDFVPGLVDLARQRFPGREACFEVANAFHWESRRLYDYVRTNLEYLQPRDWPEFVARQHAAVAPGGRLIVCHYRNRDDACIDVAAVLTAMGLTVAGQAEAPGTSVAWCEAPPAPSPGT
jgi:SAM-dependent methyltransferase